MRAVFLCIVLLLVAAPAVAQSGRSGCYVVMYSEAADPPSSEEAPNLSALQLYLVQGFPTRAMVYAQGDENAIPPDHIQTQPYGQITAADRLFLLEPGPYYVDVAGASGAYTHELVLPANTLVTIYAECM